MLSLGILYSLWFIWSKIIHFGAVLYNLAFGKSWCCGAKLLIFFPHNRLDSASEAQACLQTPQWIVLLQGSLDHPSHNHLTNRKLCQGKSIPSLHLFESFFGGVEDDNRSSYSVKWKNLGSSEGFTLRRAQICRFQQHHLLWIARKCHT